MVNGSVHSINCGAKLTSLITLYENLHSVNNLPMWLVTAESLNSIGEILWQHVEFLLRLLLSSGESL